MISVSNGWYLTYGLYELYMAIVGALVYYLYPYKATSVTVS